MGLFKKPAAPIDNDEDIRRQIRARVAKQTGIHDEEYIKTGKIGGTPVISENEKGETELSFEPVKVEAKPAKADMAQATQTVETKAAKATEPPKAVKPPKEKKPPKAAKPPKEKKPAKAAKPPKEKKPPKAVTPTKKKKSSKKKKKNIALILFILVLILAFVPFYYFLTGVNIQGPQLRASSPDSTLLLTESLLIQGTASDSDNADGLKVYYSLDNGSASILYTFQAGAGPFEASIELPITDDFLGEHSITLYAENPKGERSKTIVLNFKVAAPDITGEENVTEDETFNVIVEEPVVEIPSKKMKAFYPVVVLEV